MTTWATYAIHHPWFSGPSLKRKNLDDEYSSNASMSYRSNSNSPPSKRRRWDNLEHGMAGLSLNNNPYVSQNYPSQPQPQPQPTHDQPYFPPYSYGYSGPNVPNFQVLNQFQPDVSAMGVDSYQNPPPLQPSSVEEPVSPEQVPEVPEVKMKGTSWYEPEKDRIVITDLDDFVEESADDDAPSQAREGEVTVSPAYLNHIRSQNPAFTSGDLPTRDPSSMALVLFKPMPKFGTDADAQDVRLETEVDRNAGMLDEAASGPSTFPSTVEPPYQDDDAMDVEV